MSSTAKAIWIAVAVAIFILVELVNNAYKAGLTEGREQTCARWRMIRKRAYARS